MNSHSTQGKVPSESQQNGVLQILGCDVDLDVVRNSRYTIWHLTPLNYTVADRRD